jgi:CheY-like chemotaxis protein
MLLTASGYSARTAEHGLDALLQLHQKQAVIVISDLNMPQMSGFEFLSVVRRRFPQISVIAMSGAYDSGEDVPCGLVADAFYAKGLSHPGVLLYTIAELLRTTGVRELAHLRAQAPVWLPCSWRDSNGMSYVVVTCTECLRSFPLSIEDDEGQKIQETSCVFCPNTIRFVIDLPFSGNFPEQGAAGRKVSSASQSRSVLAYAQSGGV